MILYHLYFSEARDIYCPVAMLWHDSIEKSMYLTENYDILFERSRSEYSETRLDKYKDDFKIAQILYDLR